MMVVTFLALATTVVLTTGLPVDNGKDHMVNPANVEEQMLGCVYYDGDRSVITDESKFWPNGVVPYFLDVESYVSNGIDEEELVPFNQSLKHIEEETCIKFVPKKEEHKDYVHVHLDGNNCDSHLGRKGGKQFVRLTHGCLTRGGVMHELLHALGFEHEHTRSDRDDYITIKWENIKKDYRWAFATLDSSKYRLLTPFDFDSVMMYGPQEGAKKLGLITMVAKDGRSWPPAHQKLFLSAGDIKRIRILYKCDKNM